MNCKLMEHEGVTSQVRVYAAATPQELIYLSFRARLLSGDTKECLGVS